MPESFTDEAEAAITIAIQIENFMNNSLYVMSLYISKIPASKSLLQIDKKIPERITAVGIHIQSSGTDSGIGR